MGTFHYTTFLISDRSPEEITFGDFTLKNLIDYHNGKFFDREFKEVLYAKDNEIKHVFQSLFRDFRLYVDVLIIDLDFLNKLRETINHQQEKLHQYLLSIFFLSIMSTKSSKCKHCKMYKSECVTCQCINDITSPYRHQDVIVISTTESNKVFPEFLDWLRDRTFKSYKIPISSQEDLCKILANVQERFLPPQFKEAQIVIADNLYEYFGAYLTSIINDHKNQKQIQ